MERQIDFLPHCKERIRERGIDEKMIRQVIYKPEQTFVKGKWVIFHRRYRDETRDKEYLLRVFVQKKTGKIEVLSVYKTSKIQKYWKGDV